jgi:hypothetical protein
VLSADAHDVWVGIDPTGDFQHGSVIEIDQATQKVVGSPIPIKGNVDSISADGVHVWVGSSTQSNNSGYVTEIDASTRTKVQAAILVGSDPTVCSNGTVAWEGNGSGMKEFSAATGQEIGSVPDSSTVFFNTSSILCEANSVVFLNTSHEIVSIDDTTRVPTPVIQLPSTQYPLSFALVGGDYWVTTFAKTQNLLEFDAATGTQVGTGVSAGEEPQLLATSGSRLWLRNSQQTTLTQVDPTTGTLMDPIQLGEVPTASVDVGAQSWVATPSRLLRLSTSVTGQTLVPSTQWSTMAGTWAVGFTTSPVGALDGDTGDSITVAFPPGFEAPTSPTATLDGGGTGTCSDLIATSPTASSISIQLPAGCTVAASTLVTATFGDVTNVVPGSYVPSDFAVSTSVDQAAAPISSGITINPYVVPGAPGSVVGVVGDASATVQWTPPAGNGGPPISQYDVTALDPSEQAAGTCSTTTISLTPSCVVTGLTNGTAYTFRVTATNEVGTSKRSAPSDAIIPTVKPSPPQHLGVSSSPGMATLSWEAPISEGASAITSYLVTANPGGKTCSWISGPLSCSIAGLASAGHYTFTVKALNAEGKSQGVEKTAVLPFFGVNIFNYAQYAPVGATFAGSHVWIANGTSVTEANDVNGTITRTISGAAFGFADPQAITSDGAHVWIANTNARPGTVVELDATDGALVRVVKAAAFHFSFPLGIFSDGSTVWVTNPGNNSVSGINASTGALVRFLNPAVYKFNQPSAVYSDGTDLWVTSLHSVTEIDESTGTIVRILKGAAFGINDPVSIASDGTDLWIANTGSVTEIDASTGSLVRLLNQPSYGFNYPGMITSDGADVWVVNEGSSATTGSVTKIDASTGALVKVIKGPTFGFNDPVGITFDGSNLWVTNDGNESVTEFPATT